MTIELKGNWKKGLAFDVHTLSSTYLGTDDRGHDRWDSQRSEMGELVYRLKYHGDKKAIAKIVALLEKIKGIETMDYIVPVPASNRARGIQPVPAIAEALGAKYSIPVLRDLISKSPGGSQLKNVVDPDERATILRQHMTFTGAHDVKGKRILLLDDLYRSGATLTVATDLLYKKGKVAHVSVLTMTKTRSNR